MRASWQRYACGGVAVLVVLCLAGAVFSNSRTTDPLGVAVSPQNLLVGSDQGGSVTVHTAIPASTVVGDSMELNGIPVSGIYVDALGHIVGNFNEAAVKAIVAPPTATLVLTGVYLDGTGFSGSDTVRVTVR